MSSSSTEHLYGGPSESGSDGASEQPHFNDVAEEILYDCDEGVTNGVDVQAYNEHLSEMRSPAKDVEKQLREEKSVRQDTIGVPGHVGLNAYYEHLWQPEDDEELSKEEKLGLREQEKALMKIQGVQVAETDSALQTRCAELMGLSMRALKLSLVVWISSRRARLVGLPVHNPKGRLPPNLWET